MPRKRLLWRMSRARRVMVFGPAGSGKSTLLLQFAAEVAEASVVVLRPSDVDPVSLAANIDRATGGRIGPEDGGWTIAGPGPGVLLVDDVHLLANTPAALHLTKLLAALPDDWRVVVAGRSSEGLDLTAFQIQPDCLTLGWDDLRLGLWEIEQLFANHYGLPLSPSELPPLSRSTGGWATALQIFHLAVRAAPNRREELVQELRSQSIVLRRYLMDEVFADLDPVELQLIGQIATLETIRTDAVAELVGRRGPALVDRLHELGLLSATSAAGEYQLHMILRDQLLEHLVTVSGHEGLRQTYRKAAALLAARGQLDEASRAYLRAGRAEEAERLGGRGFAAMPQRELDRPAGGDQWTLWATGITALRRGSIDDAVRHLSRACDIFDHPPGELQRLTDELSAWLRPPRLPEPARPLGALRRWLDGDDSMAGLLGADSGLAGNVFRAIEWALAAGSPVRPADQGTDRLVHVLSCLVDAFVGVLVGRPSTSAMQEVELLLQTGVGCASLERVYLGLATMTQPLDSTATSRSRVVHLAELAKADDDRIGGAVLEIVELLHRGEEVRSLLDRSGLSRLAGLVPERAPLALPPDRPPVDDYAIRLTGAFRVGAIDEQMTGPSLRPQQLALLQVLALHAAQWVHRNQLLNWFWPDVEFEAGSHRLSNALTALRRALEVGGEGTVLRKQHDLYSLDPGDGTSDMAALTAVLRAAEVEGALDVESGIALLERALTIQRGPLLAGSPSSLWLDAARWELGERWERATQALFTGLGARSAPPSMLDLLPRLLPMVTMRDAIWNAAAELAERSDAPLLAGQLRARYERLVSDRPWR